MEDFRDGALGGVNGSGEVAGFGGAGFAAAEEEVVLPWTGDPWSAEGLQVPGGDGVVDSSGMGVDGPVLEEGGVRRERLGAEEAGELVDTSLCESRFAERLAVICTDAESGHTCRGPKGARQATAFPNSSSDALAGEM